MPKRFAFKLPLKIQARLMPCILIFAAALLFIHKAYVLVFVAAASKFLLLLH